jgi:hypothetical protein
MAQSKQKRDVIEHTGRNSTVVSFLDVRKGWEKWVLLRTDVHHDNPKCDQAMERRHLEEAMQRDALIIDNGDLFCAMQGKWDKRSDKTSLRDEHVGGNYLDLLVDTAFDFYKPYAKNWLLFGRGNHETAIRKTHETDLTDRLVDRMRQVGCPGLSGGYGGYVRFQFTLQGSQRTTRVLHHFHGAGGGGPVTRGVIQTNRMAVVHPDADILFSGHTHDEWIVYIQRQRLSSHGKIFQDTQVHVRAPGYKDAWNDGYAGWEVERMLMPKPKGAAWMRFFYRDNNVHTEVLRAQ